MIYQGRRSRKKRPTREIPDSLSPAQQVIKIVNEELTALAGRPLA